MDHFYDNFYWIWWNVTLAVAAVVMGWWWLRTKPSLLRLVLLAVWFLLLPNTLYLITDVQYLPEQAAGQSLGVMLLLVIQFAVVVGLGFVTFLLGLYPLEKYLKKTISKRSDNYRIVLMLVINFLIGFAIILGKIERTNSWDVLTRPHRVIADSQMVLSAPMQLVAAVAFGVVANLVYFNFRKYLSLLKNLL